MNKGMVSIIVPVYNGAQYIRKTVATLISQTYPSFEVLLINDGSSDDSAAVLDQLAHAHPEIRVFHKENGGVANARNFGLEQASGEFIAFCDQDDLWYDTKLEKQVPLFANPDVGLVYCGAEARYELYNKTSKPGFTNKKRGHVFADMVMQNMLTCCTAVVRKSSVEQVGGFDDDRALMGVDDWHLWIKLSACFEVDFVPEHLAIHVFHGDNYSLNDKKMHDAELVCLDKIIALNLPGAQNVDWDSVKHDLHLKYAVSYVFSSDFDLAKQAFFDAHRAKPDWSCFLNGWLYTVVPSPLLRALQNAKRRVSN
ncbi:glycosyltransferase family 2 protein [Alteromonas sp. CYL-A6]|uniref:glycosyltransferase family 2 protein n=1 Tax=Alteromonas nitratireducens TaxID=3390813 RepID=UPI0034C12566